MTLRDAIRLIESVRYKPGWHFCVDVYEHHLWVVLFTAVPDAETQKPITVMSMGLLSLGRLKHMAEHRLVRWVFNFIMSRERHEAGEYFRIGDRGIKPFDEHSPLELEGMKFLEDLPPASPARNL